MKKNNICEHELKTLSEPVVDLELTIFGGHGLHYPPIFQCIKCLKVFRTGYQECELYEIPIKTIEDMEKEQGERKHIKRKLPKFLFCSIMLLLIVVGILVLLIML